MRDFLSVNSVSLRLTRSLCASLLLIVVTTGCRQKVPAAKPAPPAKPPAVATTTEEPAGPPAESFETPLPPAVEEPTEPEFEWPDEELRERIVLLAPGGPVVVDAWLTIDGRPHHEMFDEILDTAMAAGDTNGDGRPTWKEWRENLEFFSQYVPNQAATKQQLDMWVETYDQNRDRRIARHEMAAWLGRDAGRSAAPLSLRSRRSRGVGMNIDSRLWDLLDVDRSGGLSSREMAQATGALWMLDADDDRTLVDAELTPLEEQLAGNQTNTVRATRVARRHAALHFGSHFDTGRLGYLLADMYSPRGSLAAESFSLLPGLFGELDDGDAWLGDDDLARLSSIEPHVRIAIRFGGETGAPATLEHLELAPRAEFLKVAAEPSSSRVVLMLGDSRLVFSIHDLAGTDGPTENLRRSQTQLMVHDECDVLFEYIDSNSDGRLGEREVATAADRLAACDTDSDGLLSSDELPYTMIVAFLRGENPSARNFYVPESPAIAAGSSGAPAWFVAADFNGDGDLGRREFLGPAEAFDNLDTNDDNFVDAAEAIAASEK